MFTLAALPHEGADRAALDAAVEQASVEVKAAKREVDRLTPLLTQGVVSQRRVDEAQAKLDGAEAKLRGARRGRAKLSQAERVDSANDGLDVVNVRLLLNDGDNQSMQRVLDATDAVLAEVPFPPEPDGSFLLPPELVSSVRR